MATPTSQEMLDAYMAAEKGLLEGGLDVRLGDRRLIKTDLPNIIQGRKDWQAQVAREQRVAANGNPNNIVLADFRHGGCE